jgi:TatD DNase family protein
VIFDTHAHYNDNRFDDDRDDVLSQTPQNGVGLIMNACSSLDEMTDIINMCEKYPFVYGSVGIHPEAVTDVPDDYIDKIREYAGHDKIKAIGEIGLDYYWTTETKEKQKEIFAAQIEAAKELKLPIIVHDREAHGDCLDILRSHKVNECGGVFHCYSGSAQMVKEITQKLDMYIAFGGSLTFKNAPKLREAAASVPLEKLLVETDAPYLAPVPYRGKRNSSLYLREVINLLAQIHNITPEEIEEITTENGRRLFGI